MHNTPPGDRPLGPLSRDVLTVLIEATEPREGLPRARAVAVIKEANATDEDRLWGTDDHDHLDTEVEEVLDSLLNRGYLYAVEDELYVTERDVLE